VSEDDPQEPDNDYEVTVCASRRPVFCFDLPPDAPSNIPADSVPSIGGPSGATTQGHEYYAVNTVCRRRLTEQEQQALIRRFTVPNTYTQGRPQSSGTNLVATLGIPLGFVTTTFAPNGLAGRNVTTPAHPLSGIVDRSIVNTDAGAIMVTHGFGGYRSLGLPAGSQYASMEAGSTEVDVGAAIDALNDLLGPAIFDAVDRQAARYASAHFPGCSP
jgi:hypothetical protein